MRKKLVLILLLFMISTAPLIGQTVQISDTLYNADGTKASGSLTIRWQFFTASDGTTVDGGELDYTIPSSGVSQGVVDVSLYPNIGATPSGTSYLAIYSLDNGGNYNERWVVPASGPATISDVRVSVTPSPSITISSNQILGSLRSRSINIIIGCENNCSALTDTDDQPGFWRNNIASVTISEVWCQTDTGTSIINLQRDDGSPENILTLDLTCPAAGASASGAGLVTAEKTIAASELLDFVMVTGAATGTPTRLTLNILATLDFE